jgi:hypothetical protein
LLHNGAENKRVRLGSGPGTDDHKIVPLGFLENDFMRIALHRDQPGYSRMEPQLADEGIVVRLPDLNRCETRLAVQHGNFSGKRERELIRDFESKIRIGTAAHR